MNTYNNETKDINSIIDLLSIKQASVNTNINISPELSIILKSLENLDDKISKIQNKNLLNNEDIFKEENINFPIADFTTLKVGDNVIHFRFGEGVIKEIDGKTPNLKGTVEFKDYGQKYLLLKFARLGKLTNNEA
ncbi:MAG: hypothetical protein HC905_30450 [Bacteroidales bacterium]|nr:hypothetical protein [Bacteroidales bacterium]